MSVLTKEQARDIIKAYEIQTTEDVHAAVKDLMKDVIQEALSAELDETLGYKKYDSKNNGRGRVNLARNNYLFMYHMNHLAAINS